MLLRMYLRWAEKKGYNVKILDQLAGDEAGVKSATILIEGLNAYGFLKSEKGVHRLVRISPFDTTGRRHTSFASVDVLPSSMRISRWKFGRRDLKIDTYRAGVPEASMSIRPTLPYALPIPTGIVVQCQNERSQH